MPPQIRAAFNWSLLVQVASVLLSMGLGAVLVVQEQKTQIALDHQEISNLSALINKVSETVDGIRARQPDAGTFDAKILSLQTEIARAEQDSAMARANYEDLRVRLAARGFIIPRSFQKGE